MSVPMVGALAANANDFHIGSDNAGANLYNGKLDEITWSIRKLAVSSAVRAEWCSDTRFRFHCDDGTGAAITDSTPFANNGIIVGAVTWFRDYQNWLATGDYSAAEQAHYSGVLVVYGANDKIAYYSQQEGLKKVGVV